MRKIVACMLAVVIFVTMVMPVNASIWYPGFDNWGGYTDTKTQYYFLTDESALVYSKELDFDFLYKNVILAGSDLYVPIGAYDTTKENEDPVIASDKQIKTDSVDISYKVLEGSDYINSVTLISAKKEKLKELPAGMYAKIKFTDNFMPLNKTRVAIRLVLSVNGVSYQGTAVTFRCELQNRIEIIARNSVYGALTPAQFHTMTYGGEATFDFGGGIRYTAQVSPWKRYYLNLDKTPDPLFKEIYPEAYVEFFNFKGNNATFASNGKLEIPISEQKFKEKRTRAEVYIYTLHGDTLRAISLNTVQYDKTTQMVTMYTDTLENYVFSSRALLKNGNSDEYDILRSGYADATIEEPAGI